MSTKIHDAPGISRVMKLQSLCRRPFQFADTDAFDPIITGLEHDEALVLETHDAAGRQNHLQTRYKPRHVI